MTNPTSPSSQEEVPEGRGSCIKECTSLFSKIRDTRQDKIRGNFPLISPIFPLLTLRRFLKQLFEIW